MIVILIDHLSFYSILTPPTPTPTPIPTPTPTTSPTPTPSASFAIVADELDSIVTTVPSISNISTSQEIEEGTMEDGNKNEGDVEVINGDSGSLKVNKRASHFNINIAVPSGIGSSTFDYCESTIDCSNQCL